MGWIWIIILPILIAIPVVTFVNGLVDAQQRRMAAKRDCLRKLINSEVEKWGGRCQSGERCQEPNLV